MPAQLRFSDAAAPHAIRLSRAHSASSAQHKPRPISYIWRLNHPRRVIAELRQPVLQCLRMPPQYLQRAPLETVVIWCHEDVLNGRGRPIRRNFSRQLPDFPQHLAHRAAVLDHRIVVADLKRIEPAAAMAIEDGTEVLQYRDALLGRQLS